MRGLGHGLVNVKGTGGCSPMPVDERQSITRAKLRGALWALMKGRPCVLLHIGIDYELVYVGLRGKCEKWKGHK